MFTGIIQATVKVRKTEKAGECLRVSVERPSHWPLVHGQSIAIDGVCSTVVAFDEQSFDVEYMPETLAKTSVGNFQEGTEVNLERSLTLQDFIDGSLVQGHVDTTGKIEKIKDIGETKEMTLSFPSELKKYIAPKGSIVVNGVSLTVASVDEGGFRIALIPYTLTHTNLGLLEEGSSVNIEVDMLARYAVNALQQPSQISPH
jgi:riboflavin synthase